MRGRGSSCGPLGMGLLLALALSFAPACATALPKHPPCSPNSFASSDHRCVPEAWFCSPMLYHGGKADGCDCNCGAPDPDCSPRAKTFWCYGSGMARRVSHCALCDPAPGERLMHQLYAEP